MKLERCDFHPSPSPDGSFLTDEYTMVVKVLYVLTTNSPALYAIVKGIKINHVMILLMQIHNRYAQAVGQSLC